MLKDNQAKIYRSAVAMLARREHSQRELAQKLQRKYGNSDSLEAVLAEVSEQGLQSDERYAESLARGRVNRGYGPSYVRQEMRSKGVDGELAEQVLETLDPDWQTLATEQVRRRFPDSSTDPNVWLKACRFLQRRGFDGRVTQAAVGQRPRENFSEEST